MALVNGVMPLSPQAAAGLKQHSRLLDVRPSSWGSGAFTQVSSNVIIPKGIQDSCSGHEGQHGLQSSPIVPQLDTMCQQLPNRKVLIADQDVSMELQRDIHTPNCTLI